MIVYFAGPNSVILTLLDPMSHPIIRSPHISEKTKKNSSYTLIYDDIHDEHLRMLDGTTWILHIRHIERQAKCKDLLGILT